MTRNCICPGCKKLSKGPRFHFLCEIHRNAPKREWSAWQAQDKERRKTALKLKRKRAKASCSS